MPPARFRGTPHGRPDPYRRDSPGSRDPHNATDNADDNVDNAGDLAGSELVDVGPTTRRPWLAYAVVAVLALAALAGGVRMLTSHTGNSAPSSSPSAPSGSASPSSSRRSNTPRPAGTTQGSGITSHRLASGPVLSYQDLLAQRTPGAGACEQTGLVMALRPGHDQAGLHPVTLFGGCRRPSSATSIVLRRNNGGGFGHDSAIVSYPAVTMQPGRMTRSTTHNGMTGYWDSHGVTWQIHGVYAQVQGDLPRAEIARLALASGVVGGDTDPHLSIRPVRGYHAEWSGATNGDAFSLATYSTTAIGYQPGLGKGLVQLGVWTGTTLERTVYADPAATVLHTTAVHGQTGVVLAIPGGGVGVAWQVPPYAAALVQCLVCRATPVVERTLTHIAATSELYALRQPLSTRSH